MKIEYYTKNVFGVEKKYIKDDDLAHIVSLLTRKKTIDHTDIRGLQLLGHEVVGTTVKGLVVTHPAGNKDAK